MVRTLPALVTASRTGAYYRRNALWLQCLFVALSALFVARLGVFLGLDRALLGLLFLFLTVLVAARLGLWQALTLILSGAVSIAGLYGASTPLRPLAITQVVLALILFGSTALVVSRLSAREKVHASESAIQRHRTQRLHAVSHNVLLLSTHESAERQIAEFIQQEFELDAVAIITNVPGGAGAAGAWSQQEFASEQDLRNLAVPQRSADGISRRPLLSSGGPLGVLVILGDVPPLVLDSLASLASLALERHRACINESAADAARVTEQLRTTVLDNLAHAIKTPLTIIRAASSGLLAAEHLDEVQQQLATMIDEQSERLDEMTNRLLETARMEGEEMRLQLEPIDLAALMHEVVAEFHADAPTPPGSDTVYPPISIHVTGVPGPIVADYEMLASTFRELLNNAVKYSTIGSPVSLSLREDPSEVTVLVQNHGPVICVEDRDRIFDRFYRGKDHRHAAPGTGIGLSVARRVAAAHGGRIWVTSSEEEGTTFFISLPTHAETMASTGGF